MYFRIFLLITKNLKLLGFSLFAVILLSESCTHWSQKTSTTLLLSGNYAVTFDTDTLVIPVQMHVNEEGKWSFINWTEQINLDSLVWNGKSFSAKMPFFNTVIEGTVLNDSTIEGKWTDLSREPLYQIPFTARHSNMPRFPKEKSPENLIYSVTFSPESPQDSDRAIGMFYKYDTLLYGTFLTGSGDHRFLQGYQRGDSMTLSCFDGTHLFYYKAKLEGDKLKGKFYSGKHHFANWEGVKNANAKLNHPDSLTSLKSPSEEFKFKVRDDNGDSIQFDRSKFEGKVTIVQIFGSWCPNCTDESIFFKKLYDKYHKDGLEVLPVAFERSDDFSKAKSIVHRQFKQLGLSYSPYYGEKMGKGAAAKIFAGLKDLSAYPTSVFIDKKGDVRKIHTGFYGPSTGDFYTVHTAELDSFVKMLINE